MLIWLYNVLAHCFVKLASLSGHKSMKATKRFNKAFRAGKVYRREDLQPEAKRCLFDLVSEGILQRISRGLYYCPQHTDFGIAPPEDRELIRAFLRDDPFLLISFNDYNALGIRTTQLYNEQRVYNLKRRGEIKIGKGRFHFIKKRSFPKEISPEFLIVDLINNIDKLAEDRVKVLNNVKRKALSMDQKKLRRAVSNYGGSKARKFFADL